MIDMAAYNPEKHEVILSIIEVRPWDGSVNQLLELQDKINSYMEFIVDGHLQKMYSNVRIDNVTIQIDCSHEPDAKTSEFLEAIRLQLSPYNVNIDLQCKS
ncbi:DUF6572 domain-containing protein [Synechococcus sp. PCC 7336]|uniref:DUF6572 domain-containing protein n=1 Tax=Synechococcus sp. PCC 7336 TaxID=195250 RepID=UPI000361C697|nr:DUF6572 domain-containing protein [Synechococcus sp. PCC 7336]